MSACVAILDSKNPIKFTGVAIMKNNSPAELGCFLFNLCKEQFGGDYKKMMGVLINNIGWENIYKCDFNLLEYANEKYNIDATEQLFKEMGINSDELVKSLEKMKKKTEEVKKDKRTPIPRKTGCAWIIDQKNIRGNDIPYVYVFDLGEKPQLIILGNKLQILCEFDLEGDTPDFTNIKNEKEDEEEKDYYEEKDILEAFISTHKEKFKKEYCCDYEENIYSHISKNELLEEYSLKDDYSNFLRKYLTKNKW